MLAGVFFAAEKTPARGDVIIFKAPSEKAYLQKKHLIKRIIALPQDTLAVLDKRDDGKALHPGRYRV